MVRALFAVARCLQPAVIFIDEVDSLLTQRTESDVDAMRRIKTEFLVQLDGVATSSDDRLLVIGATNRPHELDEAARRRLVKRLYIPLPDYDARLQLVHHLMNKLSHALTEDDFKWIVEATEGYSGSDMTSLCREASFGPIRSVSDLRHVRIDQVRPINRGDFEAALQQVRASVSQKDLAQLADWNKEFGSFPIPAAK